VENGSLESRSGGILGELCGRKKVSQGEIERSGEGGVAYFTEKIAEKLGEKGI